MLVQDLKNKFGEIYGSGDDIRIFFAPGRINLIGEHIDYNGGHVFPFSLTAGVYCAARLRRDRIVQIASLNYKDMRVRGFRLDNYEVTDGDFSSCPKAVFRAFEDHGISLRYGADILYSGDLPIGEGMASSAAMELVSALMLKKLYGFDYLDNKELIALCQSADILRTGFDSGILDYCAMILGRRDHGILLTTRKQIYEYVPLNLGDARIILTDSTVRHPEEYDKLLIRKQECEKALKKLKVVTNIRELCDLSIDTFNNCKDVIMNDTYLKRARHAVTENARTIRAVSALRVGNLARFGEQMFMSHASLKDDYEVSCPETDILVEAAKQLPGVYGSRMIGGGFGGAVVSIVEGAEEENFRQGMKEALEKRCQRTPKFFTVEAGDGAREVQTP